MKTLLIQMNSMNSLIKNLVRNGDFKDAVYWLRRDWRQLQTLGMDTPCLDFYMSQTNKLGWQPLQWWPLQAKWMATQQQIKCPEIRNDF